MGGSCSTRKRILYAFVSAGAGGAIAAPYPEGAFPDRASAALNLSAAVRLLLDMVAELRHPGFRVEVRGPSGARRGPSDRYLLRVRFRAPRRGGDAISNEHWLPGQFPLMFRCRSRVLCPSSGKGPAVSVGHGRWRCTMALDYTPGGLVVRVAEGAAGPERAAERAVWAGADARNAVLVVRRADEALGRWLRGGCGRGLGQSLADACRSEIAGGPPSPPGP